MLLGEVDHSLNQYPMTEYRWNVDEKRRAARGMIHARAKDGQKMVIFAKAFIIVTKALLGYCYRVRADIRVHRSYLAHVIAYLDKVLE